MGVFSDGAATGRGFYGWQFHEQDGKRSLSVRKFEGEPFTASIRVKVEIPTDYNRIPRSGGLNYERRAKRYASSRLPGLYS